MTRAVLVPAFYSIRAAAARVDRDESTIRRWISGGHITLRAGLVREDALLECDRLMRSRRGRPRAIKPGAVVLADIAAERARQDAKWGEQNHPDGTGPDSTPLFFAGVAQSVIDGPFRVSLAARIAALAKLSTDTRAAAGRVTWRDILLEEAFEALAEGEPVKLRAELVQVAAVAAQWVEAIDRRAA